MWENWTQEFTLLVETKRSNNKIEEKKYCQNKCKVRHKKANLNL